MLDTWIATELAGCDLGDARLDRRYGQVLTQLGERLCSRPADAARNWADTVGTYRFFDNPKVTAATVLVPHHAATTTRCRAVPVVLAAQDTSELRYVRQKLEGAGPLNVPHRTGFFVHVTLAVTPEGVPLGVLGFHLWARKTLGRRQTAAHSKLPLAEKESQRWLDGYRLANALAQACPATQVVSIADREGDLYEIFAEAAAAEPGTPVASWIIRAQHNRSVQLPTGGRGRLRAVVQATPPLGAWRLHLPASGGRPARDADCLVRATRVTLRPPWRVDGPLPPVTVSAVSVVEPCPPDDRAPVNWLLLTDLPVTTVADVAQVVRWYGRRWAIEVFFRTLKTGCRVEALQLRHKDRLAPCLVVYAILAWRVLCLQGAACAAPDLAADMFLERREWRLAWALTHRRQRGQPPDQATIGDAVRWVAQVGGFLARAGDGTPGAETIWRGLQRIRETLNALDALQERERTCV